MLEIVQEHLTDLKIYNTTLVNINSEYHVRSKEKEILEKNIKESSDSLSTIEEEVLLLEEAKKLLETLKTYKLQEKKDFILNIINTALGDIFNDDVKIDIEAQEKKTSKSTSQKYDIVFYQQGIEMARNEELLVTNGGGIMQVISMLFKILIGYIYSKNTFYIFDESFSQLSGENRTRLSKFLKDFCDKFKFTLVVVSQVQDLDEFADVVYDVDGHYNDRNIRTLSITNKIIPEDLEDGEGYWDLDITNFQSIERQSFQFKGYTIIRGPNNSGKSASLRAINSILYNSFDVKKFPRNSGTNRALPVNIKLSKIKNGTTKEISLKYHNSKVSFVIEGNEYYGKNLAGDKLREAVEDIGFKYINLKEFYKNFKGNLKDQTERIASTTQYDSLFLVGNKGNETEKVFNFLFNTENISMAIFKIKEDMVNWNKNYKELQEEILSKTERVLSITDELELLGSIYYIMNIQEYLNTNENINNIDIELLSTGNKINKRDEFINIFQKIKDIPEALELINSSTQDNSNNDDTIINLSTRLDKVNLELEKSKPLLEKSMFVYKLENDLVRLKDFNNTDSIINPENMIKKIELIDQIANKYTHVKYITDSISYSNHVLAEEAQLDEKIKEINHKDLLLKDKYNIHECNSCSGHGYTHYHKKEN